MKPVLSLFCGLALLGSPLLAQQHHHPTKIASSAAALSDQQFIDMAAQTDMLEAHLGQMAADQASRQDVKDYAQTLVTDHTADYQQLAALAAKDNFTLPKGLDDEHYKKTVPFEKLHGAAFDTRYIQEMIKGHTEAIAVYTKEQTDAQNPDVKSYASTALPVLQKHLDGAKDLLKKK